MQLSFLIPVYNVRPYLDECVQSVLAACLDGDEILLVDDGSTDGSSTVCDRLAELHAATIRVVHQPNAGLSAARNAALAQARGEFVCFLDSDDVLCSETLAEARQALQSHTPDVLVCDALLWRENQPDEQIRHSLPPGAPISGRQALMHTLRDNFLSTCCRLYRRSFLQRQGPTLFPVGQSYEDNSIVPILMAEATQVVYLPRPLFRYRIRSGSITQTHRMSACLDHARSLGPPLDYLQTHRWPPEVQAQAHVAALHHITVAVRHAATIRGLRMADMLQVIRAGASIMRIDRELIMAAARQHPNAKNLLKHAPGILGVSRIYALQRVWMGRWKQRRS